MKQRIGIRFVMAVCMTVLTSWAVARAEYVNYFGIEGTEWTELYTPYTIPPAAPEQSYHRLWLEGKSEIADREALKLWTMGEKEEDPVCVTHVAVDGGKVFFFAPDKNEWCLVYDFDLAPGENISIYGATTMEMGGNDLRSTDVKCVRVVPVEWAPEFEMMEMAYADGETWLEGDDKWIRGVGAMYGVLQNDFSGWVGTGGWILTEVKSHGEVIYKYDNGASVEPLVDPVAQTPKTITNLQAQPVVNPLKGEVYIVDGKKVIYK